MPMSDCIFNGPFAEQIQSHVKLKQAVGYKYRAEENHLLRFSAFTAEKYHNEKKLTKAIV